MAKENKKPKPITIPTAAKLFPDSKAYAFQIGGMDKDTYYFMIEKPTFTKPGSRVRSFVKCIKFNKKTGYLVITTVPIKNEYVIEAITIGEWYKMVQDKVQELINNPDEREKLIPYEAMGFCRKQRPLKVVSKTPKEVLPKSDKPLNNLKKVD